MRAVSTITKLKRWSINYYIDTAQSADRATRNLRREGGGLGEYYSERETRTPVWLGAGDARTGRAVDVAVREGADDIGMTIAKAVQSLRDNTLQLDRGTLVVVDEAGMVGTDDLR